MWKVLGNILCNHDPRSRSKHKKRVFAMVYHRLHSSLFYLYTLFNEGKTHLANVKLLFHVSLSNKRNSVYIHILGPTISTVINEIISSILEECQAL